MHLSSVCSLGWQDVRRFCTVFLQLQSHRRIPYVHKILRCLHCRFGAGVSDKTARTSGFFTLVLVPTVCHSVGSATAAAAWVFKRIDGIFRVVIKSWLLQNLQAPMRCESNAISALHPHRRC
jgi:hypothetical protein